MLPKLSYLSKFLLIVLTVLFSTSLQAQVLSDFTVNTNTQGFYQTSYLNAENMNSFKYSRKEPTIAAQKQSFNPAETVLINGNEFKGFERVRLTASELNKYSGNVLIQQWDTYADEKGRIFTSWELNNDVPDASDFVIVANGTISGKSTKTWVSTSTLTGETISQLTQCANGSGLPQGMSCPEISSTGWVSGNVGASKSQYIEGDSIAYRVILDNLDVGDVYEYTFGWDVTKGGLNAIDYLTTYNRSIANANPCKGSETQPGFHCTKASPTSVVPIPIDTKVTYGINGVNDGGSGDDITQAPGVLTMWGGQINEATANCTAAVGTACGLSAYNYTAPATFPAGDSSSSIKITFKATNTKMVLGWGGHIATRSDWGRPQGSVNITGSPYHMFNMSGNNLSEGTTNIFSGNREVQLSTASIIAVGRIIIYKHVAPAVPVDFNFTGNFSTSAYNAGNVVTLKDSTTDMAHTPGGANPSVPASSTHDPSFAFNGITDFTNTLTITETKPLNFSADGIACSVTEDFGTANNTTFPLGMTKGSGATSMGIKLGAGDEVTCTYFSSFTTAAGVSINGKVFDPNGIALPMALVTITDSQGNTRTERTNHFGNFSFSDIEAGTALLINVRHKNYQFSPQFIMLDDNLDSFEIFAE